jgi:flavin-binding protein dodecin
MQTIKVADIVACSQATFSEAIKSAVEEAQRTYGRLEGVEIAPPWNVLITKDGKVEFRTTVRVHYRSED